jgi:hypothetical protein
MIHYIEPAVEEFDPRCPYSQSCRFRSLSKHPACAPELGPDRSATLLGSRWRGSRAHEGLSIEAAQKVPLAKSMCHWVM